MKSKIIIEALREERKRLIRIANHFGPEVALAAIGFERCQATHNNQRCIKGKGHGSKSEYIIHHGESIIWPTMEEIRKKGNE